MSSGTRFFANYGYWPRRGMTMEQAGDALIRLVARTAGMGPGDRVLDVGCGAGASARCYIQSFGPAEVWGIDVSPASIQEGIRYIARHALDGCVHLQVGDATRMDFADDSFDRVLAVECAFRFDTRADYLREAARVLRPGGGLALTDMIPRRGADPHRYLGGMRTLHPSVCPEREVNAYDADVYADLLGAVGLVDIRIDSILDQTRVPFVAALERHATLTGGAPAADLRRMAASVRAYLDEGQDYVLVSARKPAY